MVPRKRDCEGIEIIEIKIVFWGPNSCRRRIAYIETSALADTGQNKKIF